MSDSSLVTPVLIVDDDNAVITAERRLLEGGGVAPVLAFTDASAAVRALADYPFALVLLDVRMPGLSGLDALAAIRSARPEATVAMVSGVTELDTALECIRRGAADYLVKPVEPVRLLRFVKNALEQLQLRASYRVVRSGLVGEGPLPELPGLRTANPKLRTIYGYCASIAPLRAPLLIRGETGTGKDVLARAVHAASGRSGPFVSVNAGGLDDALFSDALFGHRRGAYTGAGEAREGLVAKARGGTLFLDEIGDLESASQVKLLRLIENNEYLPLGSDDPRSAEARIILATHQDLRLLMGDSRFRKDLYYRISTYEVELPPLRERPEDIPELFERFLEEARAEQGGTFDFAESSLDLLLEYDFPGNIRELRAFAQRAATRAIASASRRVDTSVLLEEGALAAAAARFERVRHGGKGSGLEDVLESLPSPLPDLSAWQGLLIREALRRSGGNISMAARSIGQSPQALHQRLRRRTAARLEP